MAAHAIQAAFEEFLHSQDGGELLQRLKHVRPTAGPDYGAHVLKRCFTTMLECHSDERVEQLQYSLASLAVCGGLTSAELAAGLGVLIARVDDYALDNPASHRVLGALIAHLLQNEVLTDEILVSCDDESPGAATVKAYTREMLYSSVPTPLAQARGIMREVVSAYFDSGDLASLQENIASLHARHTLHELVRKVVQHCLTATAAAGGSAGPDPLLLESASDALHQLSATGFLPAHAAVEGFLRLLGGTADLVADVPAAASLIPRFVARAVADGVLPTDFPALARGVLAGGQVAGGGSGPAGQTVASSTSASLSTFSEAVRTPLGGWGLGAPPSVLPPPLELPSAAAVGSGLPAAHGQPPYTQGQHARRCVSSALEALSAVEAVLTTAHGSEPALTAVWGYTGRPLGALREEIRALVGSVMRDGSSVVVVQSFVEGVSGLGRPAAPSSSSSSSPPGAVLHPMVQADVVYALLHTAGTDLLHQQARAGGGGDEAGAAGAGSGRAAVAVEALGGLLRAGVVQHPSGAAAFARALQALEQASDVNTGPGGATPTPGGAGEEEEEEGGCPSSSLLGHPAAGPLVRGAFACLRAAGARALDLLAHPSASLSQLLASGAGAGARGSGSRAASPAAS